MPFPSGDTSTAPPIHQDDKLRPKHPNVSSTRQSGVEPTHFRLREGTSRSKTVRKLGLDQALPAPESLGPDPAYVDRTTRRGGF